MGVLRERIMSGLTWLVVLLTPLTGVPHFVCRCPNGRVKPYCLGLASKATGCCCGCACCRRVTDGRRCCCCTGGASSVQRPSTEPSPDGLGSVEKSGCSKTLAEQEALAPSAGKRTALDSPLGEVGLPASHLRLNPLLKEKGERFSSHDPSPVPPAELVILLGRLLI